MYLEKKGRKKKVKKRGMVDGCVFATFEGFFRISYNICWCKWMRMLQESFVQFIF